MGLNTRPETKDLTGPEMPDSPWIAHNNSNQLAWGQRSVLPLALQVMWKSNIPRRGIFDAHAEALSTLGTWRTADFVFRQTAS